MDTMIAPNEEGVLDLSDVQLVQEVTTDFEIASVEEKHSQSPKGTGTYIELTFQPVDEEVFPHAITLRLFREYESAVGASTDWVQGQLGTLKRIALAVTGTPAASFTNPQSAVYVGGKVVSARTFENNEGRASLRNFRPTR